MRIIPVIDLMGGQVVHGIAGQRSRYRPITSVLAEEATPRAIAQAFAQRLGAREVYVADLEAIAGREPDWDAYGQIAAAGLRMLVDAGIGNVRRAQQMADWAAACSPSTELIVALESVRDPDQLPAIHGSVAPHRSVFSLDLRNGQPQTDSPAWRTAAMKFTTKSGSRIPVGEGAGGEPTGAARRVADFVVRVGFRRLLVLDLAAVGVNQGPGAAPLCRELRDAYPDVELISGGGVRGLEDVRYLARCGCDAALVASALHDGRLTAEQIRV